MRYFPKRKNILLVLTALGIVLLLGILTVLFLSSFSEKEPSSSVEAEAEKGYFRVLVAAQDRSSGLSDVILLVSLNRDAERLSVLQIPRDTYVNFRNEHYRKINGVPSVGGGMEALCELVEEAFQIKVDRYVRLSGEAFRRAVDAIGGVEIFLENDMDYDDPAQNLSIHLKAGKQTLSGEEAEWFVRYRSGYLRGDLDRLDAQKVFLSVLAEKVLALRSPVQLVRLASAVLPETDTNLGFSDLTMLAKEVCTLKKEAIEFVTAPGEDVTGKSGGSFYVLSAPSMEELLCRVFGKQTDGFDPQKRFLNGSNSAFRKIYEKKYAYRLYSVAESKEETLSEG